MKNINKIVKKKAIIIRTKLQQLEINETSPVNIPCKQKQFMIPGQCGWETFKWLIAWKWSLPRPKFFFENLSQSSTLSHTITKKPKRVNLQRKSHWGFWSSCASPLIALSFRFLIKRILFRVAWDSVFFFRACSNRFVSSSMLFFRHVYIFLSNRITTFYYQKQKFCFAFIIIPKNTYFNMF